MPTCLQRGLWEWTQTLQPRWAEWRGWLYNPLFRIATSLTGSDWHLLERKSPAVKHPRAQDSTWTDSAHSGWIWLNKMSWWAWCCRLAPTRWLHHKLKRWPRRCTTSSARSVREEWRCATRLGTDPSLTPSNLLKWRSLNKSLNSGKHQQFLEGFERRQNYRGDHLGSTLVNTSSSPGVSCNQWQPPSALNGSYTTSTSIHRPIKREEEWSINPIAE